MSTEPRGHDRAALARLTDTEAPRANERTFRQTDVIAFYWAAFDRSLGSPPEYKLSVTTPVGA